MAGTMALQSGRLELESIIRAPLVVVADPAVAASGPPVTLDELGGSGAALLERPAGTILALANTAPEAALFVWAGRDFVAVVGEPDRDVPLEAVGDLTVCSGRLVIGAPEVVAAWGPDVDTGDGSAVRARMHRGRQRLGLIVVVECPAGEFKVAAGPGAVMATLQPQVLPMAG